MVDILLDYIRSLCRWFNSCNHQGYSDGIRNRNNSVSYKIQSRTIFGWVDVAGTFPTIQEAQEKIDPLERLLFYPPFTQDLILRIVDTNEPAINDNFAYKLEELI